MKKRLGQPNSSFLSWPWRSFIFYALGLAVAAMVFGAGVSVWMAHAGRVVETEVTNRFDLSVGLALAVIPLSPTVALRYWKRAPFYWASFAVGILIGTPAFGLGFVCIAAIFMLISSKLRDLMAFWWGL